jgi:DNA-directed RNA polymerase subunit beta'
MIKGSGRFRQNLLGKRVDYSGRSVIVVGPELKSINVVTKRNGFRVVSTFLIRELILKELTKTFSVQKKLIQSKPDMIWDVLREVVENRPILLNRAPTLHRLGIQASLNLFQEKRFYCILLFVRHLMLTLMAIKWLFMSHYHLKLVLKLEINVVS